MKIHRLREAIILGCGGALLLLAAACSNLPAAGSAAGGTAAAGSSSAAASNGVPPPTTPAAAADSQPGPPPPEAVAATPAGADDQEPAILPEEPADEPAPDEALPEDDETADETADTADDTAATSEQPADSETLLHQALEAYESADVFWHQGSFEDAFAALDRAYELMADVPPNGDAAVTQEKDNLRRLISHRLVEIYASRQTAVGDLDRSIPLVVNDDVRREIASFQGPERQFFLDSYRRSGRYRPMILAKLHEAGLPEQLSWLPMVESGFAARAFSHARALGLWQFIASTGYRYDLHRSWWVDERMDPEKSTRAALAYLTDLHNLFGDWLTALAAYNCGEQTILREIHRQPVSYFDRFWDLYQRLPRETRRYVPRFMAVLAILANPEGYGFDLPDPSPAEASETVEIARPARLKTLDRTLGLESGTLEQLNPELRRGATPDDTYQLRVPTGQSSTLVAALPDLPKWEPPSRRYTVHRVRRGETLSGVASRYRTSVRALMQLNHLRSANRIWPGQQLQVPDRARGRGYRRASLAPGSAVNHRVRAGDSLWVLARRYGTTVDRIRQENRLRDNLLHPGQVLVIHGPEVAEAGGGAGGYVVRSGDTLGGIARAHDVPLRRLLEENHLSRHSTIYPGQTLQIPK